MPSNRNSNWTSEWQPILLCSRTSCGDYDPNFIFSEHIYVPFLYFYVCAIFSVTLLGLKWVLTELCLKVRSNKTWKHKSYLGKKTCNRMFTIRWVAMTVNLSIGNWSVHWTVRCTVCLFCRQCVNEWIYNRQQNTSVKDKGHPRQPWQSLSQRMDKASYRVVCPQLKNAEWMGIVAKALDGQRYPCPA